LRIAFTRPTDSTAWGGEPIGIIREEGKRNPQRMAASGEHGEQLLRRVRTNRYGVAKVSGLSVPGDNDSSNFSLSFRARDKKGEVGHHIESMCTRAGLESAWRPTRPCTNE